MKYITIAVLFAGLLLAPAWAGDAEDYVAIEKDGLRLEATPHFGGRITALSLDGRDSVIIFMRDAAENRPEKFSPRMSYMQILGNSVWAAPQSEWWNHQDVVPERAGAVWPPDPYLSMADVESVETTKSKIVLEGVKSDVAGVQIKQQYKLKKDGVEVTVQFQNWRHEDIAWTPWMNTRVPVEAKIYAPVDNFETMRVTIIGDGMAAPVFTESGGVMTLERAQPPDGKSGHQGKAFFDGPDGWLAAFYDGQAFIMEFKKAAQEDIHAEHAPLEIYVKDVGPGGFIELERHYPINRDAVTAGKAAKTIVREYWRVLPYDGADDAAAHRAFLKNFFAEKNKSGETAL